MHKSCTTRRWVTSPIRPLSLDHVVDEQLRGAQLKLVVARVEHEQLMAASDATKALAIGERLHDSLKGPRPMAAPTMVLQVGGPATPAATQEVNLGAWQYVSEGRDWVATVAPGFFSLETLSYERWDDFLARLDQLVAAVADVLSPALVQRVGLRYIDELRAPGVTTAADWSGRIAPNFLGAANDPHVGASVTSIQQAVEIQGPNGTKVVLRHGTVRTVEGQPAYLLDQDCSIEDSGRFDAATLITSFDQLHILALGVFQRAITDTYYGQLKEGDLR